MANRLAFLMQYEDITTIERVEFKEPNIRNILSPVKLYQFIGQIEYNCCTNAGYSTLPRDVEDVLMEIKLCLADRIMEQSGNTAI